MFPSLARVCEPVALCELAQVVRSKNAGPTLLTLDVFFRDAAACTRAACSPALAPLAVPLLYEVPAGSVQRHLLPKLRAIKFTLSRAVCEASPGDGDLCGAQQHAPLLGLTL
jgi:hypothetical protein